MKKKFNKSVSLNKIEFRDIERGLVNSKHTTVEDEIPAMITPQKPPIKHMPLRYQQETLRLIRDVKSRESSVPKVEILRLATTPEGKIP
jgi:hypothetical protein